MGAEFLLEIGAEEIPAGMIRDALDHLADAVAQALARHGLAGGEAWRSATPRRLVVRIDNVPERQADRDEEVVGPPATAGVDAAGAWTRAALGFAAKQGVDAAALAVTETPKGRYVAVRKRVAGRTAADVLAEALPSRKPCTGAKTSSGSCGPSAPCWPCWAGPWSPSRWPAWPPATGPSATAFSAPPPSP